MTDSVARILANTKRVFKTKDNNLKYIVIADDENGKEINYTLIFNYDGITVERTIANDKKVEVISNVYKYDRDVFFSILENFDTLIGNNISIYSSNINLTPNTIPTIVFTNLVYKKEGYSDDEKEHIKGEYADDFIAYNNKNYFINENNYFTFLKFATEVEYFQIFTYLLLKYPDYVKNLNEKQIAILTYTSFKKDPSFSDRIADLGFKFGFELLRLAVYNNDYEVLEHLYHNDNADMNAVKYGQTILDYAFEKNVNIKMVEFLIDHNIKIFDGHSIVEYAKRNPTIVKSFFKREDIDDILKIRDSEDSWSVAHVIARNSNSEVAKLLFERENISDILRMKGNYDNSVAHEIARNSNSEVVKLLFKRKDIDTILRMGYESGWSVAHVIAENENPEVVKLLFERENIADILKIENLDDWSVAHVIAGNENFEVVKLLFKRKDIDTILRMGYESGWSIAHVIAGNENFEVVKLLFKRKDIDTILRMGYESGWSVAHRVAENRNPEVVKFLLNRKDIELEKEDVNLIKQNFSNNEEIMNLLLVRGLISANNATEEVNVITENETPEEMNAYNMCTIC